MSLDCAFELLNLMKPLGRDSAVEVARRLSSLVNIYFLSNSLLQIHIYVYCETTLDQTLVEIGK